MTFYEWLTEAVKLHTAQVITRRGEFRNDWIGCYLWNTLPCIDSGHGVSCEFWDDMPYDLDCADTGSDLNVFLDYVRLHWSTVRQLS